MRKYEPQADAAEYHFFGAEIEQNRVDTRMAQKQRYRRLIGLGFGAAGLAAGLAGLDIMVAIGIWALGGAAWMYLKAI